MDRTDALRQIDFYVKLIDKLKTQKARPFNPERTATVRLLNEHLDQINQILKMLTPDFAIINARTAREHSASEWQVRRARRLLTSWQHVEHHSLRGREIGMPLKLLDPIVSNAALPLWKAEKYRQAVGDAATSLNSFAQDRIGRHDISDKDLMAQAFSDKDPEFRKSRLRCPGNEASETVRSQQEGARAFAIGAFQAFRNPSHHLTGDWNPVTAFHHLTALSQVAHWFRYWKVVEYIPPPLPLPDLSSVIREKSIGNDA